MVKETDLVESISERQADKWEEGMFQVKGCGRARPVRHTLPVWSSAAVFSSSRAPAFPVVCCVTAGKKRCGQA
jgi:hypothetical protein